MRQLDVPFTGLMCMGQPALAWLHAILVNDLLTGHPYRTNTDLGKALGVGPKRISQYLDTLAQYGLVAVGGSGSKRTIAIDFLPNDRFVGDLLFLLGGIDSTYNPDTFTIQQGHLDQTTRTLLSAWQASPRVAFPDPEIGVSAGYVTTYHSGTELAFYYTNCSTTYYYVYTSNNNKKDKVKIDHDTLSGPIGLAALALKPKKLKAKRAPMPNDASEWGSWTFVKRNSSLDEIREKDTQYWDAVIGLIRTWDDAMRTETTVLRDHYVMVRTLLKEKGMQQQQIVGAIWAYARDPFWGQKVTGFDQFFNKPLRVQEWVDKSKKHDRFARNLVTVPETDDNGNEVEAYEF